MLQEPFNPADGFTEEQNAQAFAQLLRTIDEASGFIQYDKGIRFETLVRDYLSKDASQQTQYETIYTYKNWLEYMRQQGQPVSKIDKDIGIDLVAKNRHDDHYTAIQCKFYGEKSSITKEDLDSFISASASPFFTQRLVVTTSDKAWSRNLEEQLAMTLDKPLLLIKRSDLARCSFYWGDYLQGVMTTNKKFKPKDFQEDAIKAVLKGFSEADRGKLIMACGTGKTFTSLKIAERYLKQKSSQHGFVLFLVPSLSLLSQTLTSWTQQCEMPIQAFAVCSDAATGKVDLEEIESLTRRNELSYPATTNPDALEKQVRHALSKEEGMTVIFSTYQSIETIYKAQERGMPAFDLTICDEAHRTASGHYTDEKEGFFTKIHDEAYIKSDKRLYMTATPKIFAEDLKKDQEVVVYSMDDESVYGPTFYTVNFTKAVFLEQLVDYKVVVLGVDQEIIKDMMATDVAMQGGLSVNHASKIIGAWKALTKADLQHEKSLSGDLNMMKRAVAFAQVIHPSEKQDRVSSKQFTEYFASVVDQYRTDFIERHGNSNNPKDLEAIKNLPKLKVEAKHIDGSMNALEKDGLLAWLKEEPADETCKILFNVRCLSEGVDVPSLDAVIFLSPRKSQVDVVQTVGRVMRTAKGKKRGYVIIPVVTTSGLSADMHLEHNKEFDVVWQVLKALKSIDNDFGSVVDGTNGTLNPDKIEVTCLTANPINRGGGWAKVWQTQEEWCRGIW